MFSRIPSSDARDSSLSGPIENNTEVSDYDLKAGVKTSAHQTMDGHVTLPIVRRYSSRLQSNGSVKRIRRALGITTTQLPSIESVEPHVLQPRKHSDLNNLTNGAANLKCSKHAKVEQAATTFCLTGKSNAENPYQVSELSLSDESSESTEKDSSPEREQSPLELSSVSDEESDIGYLVKGLFSSPTSATSALNMFPLPMHHGLVMLDTKSPFQLTDNLREMHDRQREQRRMKQTLQHSRRMPVSSRLVVSVRRKKQVGRYTGGNAI